MKKTKVGIIGCGAISGAYLSQCPKFEILEVAACADIIPERAQAKAKEHGVALACTPEELLGNPEIDIIVNLTIPIAHYEIAMTAVTAGKSVWNEKPLTLTREQGSLLLATARKNGVLVGCAPDTFLGAGTQTCRKLIDEGAIGKPVAAVAFMMCGGHENWHPDPEFYYKAGAGPMFDMGPYYLTALVNLLGPVRRVTGSAQITRTERTITSQPKYGTKIQVEVPTHVAGVMDFCEGAIATIITSFDVSHASNMPNIEIYGTEGTIRVPDPNSPSGPIKLRRLGDEDWTDAPFTHDYASISRSTGVADMAYAMRSGRPHRASGDLALHVLDIMHAFHDASREGRHIDITTSCTKPAPMVTGLPEGTLDD